MATFPAIQATAPITYQMPTRPSTTVAGRSGYRVDFSHDPHGVNAPFDLTFSNVVRSDRDLILDHYRGERGHGRFSIPSTVWPTHPAMDDMVPYWSLGSPVLYKYTAPPSWEQTPGGLYNVRVSLRSSF